MPKAVTSLWIQLLHVFKQFLYGGTVRVFLVWAGFQLFLVMPALGILAYVGFLAEAEWSDDGQRHLPHFQFGRHR